MKKELIQIASIPLIILLYGLYLYQQKQGMQDIVGILMIITSIIGTIIGIIIHQFAKKKNNSWYLNILEGLAGIVIMYAVLIVLSRFSS